MAGAFDLYSGNRSISGANLFKVDKSPLEQLNQGIEDVIGKHGENSGVPFLSLFQALVDALLLLPQSSQPVTGQPGGNIDGVHQFFGGLMNFLGGLQPLDKEFSIPDSADNFIHQILHPADLLAPLENGIIPLIYFDLEELGQALIDLFAPAMRALSAPIITAVGDAPPDPTGLPDGTLWLEI